MTYIKVGHVFDITGNFFINHYISGHGPAPAIVIHGLRDGFLFTGLAWRSVPESFIQSHSLHMKEVIIIDEEV